VNEALQRYIQKLEEVRRSICEYGPNATRCDCKFYMPGRDGPPAQGRFGLGTEVTGCPELRVLIAMMKSTEGGAPLADLWWRGKARVRLNVLRP
jgi:hypothetical protein